MTNPIPVSWSDRITAMYIKDLQSTLKAKEGEIERLMGALHEEISKHCDEKMDVCGNIECSPRRLLISGLGGCLCREDNCHRVREALADEGKGGSC